MALLKIIKLSTKTWKHNSDIDGDFILTKFYAKQEDNDFLLVESYGAKRRKYKINEIEVYDIGGSAETFADFDALFLRLEVLKYPAFYVDGDPSALDLQSVTDNGNSTTNTIITPIVKLPKGSFNVEIFPVDLTANRKLEAPNKDGIIATIEDVNLKLDKDFSTLPNATLPLDFTETIIVRQSGVTKKVESSELNKSFIFTIELIEYLTVDFYAPNELRIDSIQQIVNLPSIDILVNDSAYTLGDIIARGDKITIVSDIVGVINLIGNYE